MGSAARFKGGKGYVVYWIEQLRDGEESGSKIFSSLEEALQLIEKYANGFAGCNITFQLFELGKEVPLKEGEVEEEVMKEVITRRVRKFKVNEGGD